MTDIQLALLLALGGALVFYTRKIQAAASGERGISKAARAHGVLRGCQLVLWGHAANLVLCIPFFAIPPHDYESGHDMLSWLALYLVPWLRWAGLTQMVYLSLIWKTQKDKGRRDVVHGTALAGGLTLAASALGWASFINGLRHASFSLQAASGILTIAALAAAARLVMELRRGLRR